MDLSSQIAAAINAWLAAVAQDLLGPALAAAGELLFQTPAFDGIPGIVRSWEIVRGVADALFVLAWLAAGLLVMISGGADARYTAKILVPRVALGAILAHASLPICGALIRLNNGLVTGLLGPMAATNVLTQFREVLVGGHAANQIVAIVVGLAAAVLAVLLVALFVGRALLLALAVVLAPLALATYALPQTEELAKLWWRIFSALLFVQVLQAALVAVGLTVLANTDWLGGPVSDLVSGLLIVTLLYLLLKLPFVAYQWAFRQPLGENRVVQSVVIGARALAAL